MTIQDIIKDLDLRFTSGNDVPVKQAVIKAEQWEVIKKRLQELEEKVKQHFEDTRSYN